MAPFNIDIIYCYPLFKKTADILVRPTDDSSTSFKLIINSNDNNKFYNPDIWPDNTLVTPWVFHDKPSSQHQNVHQPQSSFQPQSNPGLVSQIQQPKDTSILNQQNVITQNELIINENITQSIPQQIDIQQPTPININGVSTNF